LIRIEALVDDAGVLRFCKAVGHGGRGNAGSDIVCAAVSVLMRGAHRTLSGRKGITLRADAPQPGLFWLEADYSAEGKEFLFASGAFLLEGLASVAEEFPENCKLIVRTERRS